MKVSNVTFKNNNNKFEVCMLCEDGGLHRVESLLVLNTTNKDSVKSVHLKCDNCGCEVASSKEVLENKKTVIELLKGITKGGIALTKK